MTVSLAGGIGTSPLSRCGEAVVVSGCQVKVGWTGWIAVCRCWARGVLPGTSDQLGFATCSARSMRVDGAADTSPDPMAYAMT